LTFLRHASYTFPFRARSDPLESLQPLVLEVRLMHLVGCDRYLFVKEHENR
jgi:hypothetical protein